MELWPPTLSSVLIFSVSNEVFLKGVLLSSVEVLSVFSDAFRRKQLVAIHSVVGLSRRNKVFLW